MKLVLYVFGFLLLFFTSRACDICGCGPGSYYLGILPEFKKRFIGFRYQQKGLITHRSANGTTSYLTTDETYRSLELWGAFALSSRFRIIGAIPVNLIEKKNQGLTKSQKGLGDINLTGFYKLYEKNSTVFTDKRMVQSLWAGIGLKLPTGKYNPEEKNQPASIQNSFQLGTGSFDVSVNIMHDIRLMDFGVNTNLSYKMNSSNRYGYRYGNKFSYNGLAYYKFRVKEKLTIAPNAGILYESSSKDVNELKNKVEESGGFTTMAILGMETGFRQWSAGINFQTPLSQQLSGNRVLAKQRLLLHLSISL